MTTIEIKKNYLRGFQSLNREINQKQYSLGNLIDSRDRITSLISLAPGNNGMNDRMRICDDIIDMENELKQKINEAMTIRTEIQEKINLIDNLDERVVLNYRYIDNLTLEDIANKMNFSYSTIKRFHQSALNQIMLD